MKLRFLQEKKRVIRSLDLIIFIPYQRLPIYEWHLNESRKCFSRKFNDLELCKFVFKMFPNTYPDKTASLRQKNIWTCPRQTKFLLFSTKEQKLFGWDNKKFPANETFLFSPNKRTKDVWLGQPNIWMFPSQPKICVVPREDQELF